MIRTVESCPPNPVKSWNFAELGFIDRDQVIRDLRRAVARATARYPEIVKVLVFSSFVRGNWMADSDADLIVVVRKGFPNFLDRGDYHIFVKSIPTYTLVYTESKFVRLAQDPTSFLAQNLPTALEL